MDFFSTFLSFSLCFSLSLCYLHALSFYVKNPPNKKRRQRRINEKIAEKRGAHFSQHPTRTTLARIANGDFEIHSGEITREKKNYGKKHWPIELALVVHFSPIRCRSRQSSLLFFPLFAFAVCSKTSNSMYGMCFDERISFLFFISAIYWCCSDFF